MAELNARLCLLLFHELMFMADPALLNNDLREVLGICNLSVDMRSPFDIIVMYLNLRNQVASGSLVGIKVTIHSYQSTKSTKPNIPSLRN